MKKYNVAIVGATGAVGQEMLNMLKVRNFPVNKIYPFASFRSVGKKIGFASENYDIIELNYQNVKKFAKEIDLALFSAGATVSKEYAPIFAEENIYVVDNSSCWRMDKNVPLVVPEVNPETLSKDKKIIANPNCSTIQMVVVLNPLHKFAKIKRIIVSTYQSVSGAGAKAMLELRKQVEEIIPKIGQSENIVSLEKSFFTTTGNPNIFPMQIAFNLIPQIDKFLDNSYTKEEMKMVLETRKIIGDDNIRISSQCVRVPVFRSHSESIWIETEKKLSAQVAKELLSKSEGVKVVDSPFDENAENRYPTPLDATNEQITYVGRIREDISVDNGLVMWIVSDNLLKGAALNAVQILETLVVKNII